MKKATFDQLIRATWLIVMATILSLATACKDPEPKPIPDPNKENPDNNGDNPNNNGDNPNNNGDNPNNNGDNPNNNGEEPNTFKKWLVINAEGELAEIPIPFIDFTKGPEAAKEWEKGYGSTLYKEETAGGNLVLMFDTNDPEKLNLKRFYSFRDTLLQEASYSIASKLVFESSFTQLQPSDSFEVLLHSKGYRKADQQPQGQMAYTNGELILFFSYVSNNKETALVMIHPVVKGGTSSFDKSRRDMPLLLADKYINAYGETAITAHENKLQRKKSSSESQEGVLLTFIDEAHHTNFYKVKYDLKDGVDSKGNQRRAQIVAFSKAFATIDMMQSAEVQEYMTAQGFKFDKDLSIGALTAKIYIADTLGFKLTVAPGNEGETIWVYDKVRIVDDNPSNPDEEKRKAYYLPFYLWDAPITGDSPIVTKEKERGFEVSFKPAGSDQYSDYVAEITARPPFDKDYTLTALKKLGISSITYSVDKYLTGSKNVKADWNLNYALKKDKHEEGFKQIIDFLNKEGFIVATGGKHTDQITTMINSHDSVEAQIVNMFGSMMVTFRYKATN